MNAHHITYTVSFDVPMKFDGFELNQSAHRDLETSLTQIIKSQLFFFKKEGNPPFSSRSRNIKVSYDTTIISDFQI